MKYLCYFRLSILKCSISLKISVVSLFLHSCYPYENRLDCRWKPLSLQTIYYWFILVPSESWKLSILHLSISEWLQTNLNLTFLNNFETPVVSSSFQYLLGNITNWLSSTFLKTWKKTVILQFKSILLYGIDVTTIINNVY